LLAYFKYAAKQNFCKRNLPISPRTKGDEKLPLPQLNLPMGGVVRRSAFIVDKNGIIQYAESHNDPYDLPNFNAIKAKLAELK